MNPLAVANRLAVRNRLLAADPLVATTGPAATLDVEPFLVAWVEAQVPELAGRVFPHRDGLQHAPPYCLYSRVSGGRVGSQVGPAGTSVVRVQVDVWDTRREAARGLADRIEGWPGRPGLNGLRGWLTLGGRALFVQSAAAVGEFETDDRPAGAAGDVVWYCCSRDYRIGFTETLRAAP